MCVFIFFPSESPTKEIQIYAVYNACNLEPPYFNNSHQH